MHPRFDEDLVSGFTELTVLVFVCTNLLKKSKYTDRLTQQNLLALVYLRLFLPR